MIGRFEKRWRTLRRLVSRGRWLGRPGRPAPGAKKEIPAGVVFVRIEGMGAVELGRLVEARDVRLGRRVLFESGHVVRAVVPEPGAPPGSSDRARLGWLAWLTHPEYWMGDAETRRESRQVLAAKLAAAAGREIVWLTLRFRSVAGPDTSYGAFHREWRRLWTRIDRVARLADRSRHHDYDLWLYAPGRGDREGLLLAPADAPLPDDDPLGPEAPGDAARRWIDEQTAPSRGPSPRPSAAPPIPRRREHDHDRPFLRVMTYNVHSCVGMDGRVSPSRVARVIARYRPDVVALQEVDVRRARTRGEDQAETIARLVNMSHWFHPALELEEERYGDAILSRFPLHRIKADALPGLPDRPRLEPRGALLVEIEWRGRRVRILNTHLGLLPRERAIQAGALLGSEWIGAVTANTGAPREEAKPLAGPLILCGDFNATPQSAAYRAFAERLTDVQNDAAVPAPRNTWFGRRPLARIDHIFITPDLRPLAVQVPRTPLVLKTSDHLPLIVDLVFA